MTAASPPSHRPSSVIARSVDTGAAAPWWRFGIVWLVAAGPVAAVLVGFTILTVAWNRADPSVAEEPAAHTSSAGTDAAAADRRDATAALPALHARNHAATPPR